MQACSACDAMNLLVMPEGLLIASPMINLMFSCTISCDNISSVHGCVCDVSYICSAALSKTLKARLPETRVKDGKEHQREIVLLISHH